MDYTVNNLFLAALNGGGLGSLPISSSFVPPDIIAFLAKMGIAKWNQLDSLSELDIINSFGFSTKSLYLIQDLWAINPIVQILTKLMPPFIENSDSWDSFNSVIRMLVLTKVRHSYERNLYILLRRMGFENKPPATLGELGTELRLTRERIRQVEKKMREKLEHPSSLLRLKPLWIAVDAYLAEAYGMINLDSLSLKLKTTFNWNRNPSISALAEILSLNARFVTDKEAGVVYTKNFSCANCETAIEYLQQIVEDIGELQFLDAAYCLADACRNNCQKILSSSNFFSHSFIAYLVNSFNTLSERVKIKSGRIYSRNMWELRYGNLPAATDIVLELSGRPMHFSDVFEELKRWRKDLPLHYERNIHAILDRSKNVLLWDRGTFIHRKHAVFPFSLLREIEDWVRTQLEEDIPFISVYGAFKAFKERCLSEGISSEYALYSCLRESADPAFAYPRFPYIYLKKNFSQHLPVTLVLEKFLQEAGGPVSYIELKTFATGGLFIKELMWNQYVERIPNVVRTSNWGFLHTDFLEIDEEKLDDIIAYAQGIISKEGHASIVKVYEDKRISCKLMGIDSPIMLFSIFQLYAGDKILARNYPQIRSLEKYDAKASSRGIVNEVIAYIKNKSAPCTYQELEEHFVSNLGYNEQAVFLAAYKEDIYKYLQNCLVHKETIDWNDKKQEQVERIANNVFGDAIRAGKCFGLIDTILERGALPELKNGVFWTRLLLADVLTSQNKFRTLGNQKNAFVPVPNDLGIEKFEDLIYELLKREYDGASNLASFESNLRNLGVIIRGIAPSVLGKSKKVRIVGKEIIIAELMGYA